MKVDLTLASSDYLTDYNIMELTDERIVLQHKWRDVQIVIVPSEISIRMGE